MKRLIQFELMKIFQQKSIYFIGLLLFILYSLTVPYYDLSDLKYYKQLEGPVTQQKIDYVNQKAQTLHPPSNPFTTLSSADQNLYGVLDNYQEQQNYQQLISKRIQALSQKSTPQAQLEKSMLQKIHLNVFQFNRGPGETIDFVNTMGFIFTGLMIVVGLTSVLTREYSSGVIHYIFTSKLGRRPIVTAKLLASMIYTLAIVVFWILFDVIQRLILLGPSGWQLPIQVLNKYYLSPYPFTMAEYFGIQILTLLIGALGFAILVVLISALCRHTIISFIISGIVYGLPIVWTSILYRPTNWLIDISYTSIMKVQDLYMTFHAYTILGRTVLAPIVILSVSILVSLLFLWGLYRYIRRKELVA